jgi:two-component system, LuxR family, sensor kinase FixL
MATTPMRLELQALLDAAVDGIVAIDYLGRILTFNRAAERIFGYEAHEVVGRSVGILTTCMLRNIGRGREVEARSKDGKIFPAFLAMGVIPESNPPRFVGFVRDVTAQHESEADAHRLQERLMHVSRLATVGEMASGIAHELTGRGLSISRTIVTAHEGVLEYFPNEPRGACFKVQLPAMRAEPVGA